MDFGELADDNVLEICRQMDDRTFLNFLQTSRMSRTACLEEFRRRLLTTKDPDFIARSQDPTYVLEFVRRTLEEVRGYSAKLGERRRIFEAERSQLPRTSSLRIRAEAYAALRREFEQEERAYYALISAAYNRIGRALFLLLKINPDVLWESMELIRTDSELGPDKIRFLSLTAMNNPKHAPLLEALKQRYPEIIR